MVSYNESKMTYVVTTLRGIPGIPQDETECKRLRTLLDSAHDMIGQAQKMHNAGVTGLPHKGD